MLVILKQICQSRFVFALSCAWSSLHSGLSHSSGPAKLISKLGMSKQVVFHGKVQVLLHYFNPCFGHDFFVSQIRVPDTVIRRIWNPCLKHGLQHPRDAFANLRSDGELCAGDLRNHNVLSHLYAVAETWTTDLVTKSCPEPRIKRFESVTRR
jgi:hypothetical protein